MNIKTLIPVALVLFWASCRNTGNTNENKTSVKEKTEQTHIHEHGEKCNHEGHEHSHETDEHEEHSHEGDNHGGQEAHEHNHSGHRHEAEETHEHKHEAENADEHNHSEHSHKAEGEQAHNHTEEAKLKITAYSDNFEVFAEADPFSTGQNAEVLAHFSHLPGFEALTSGSISLKLTKNGKATTQKLDKPTRKGIYKFAITATEPGQYEMSFEITEDHKVSIIDGIAITVFDDAKEAEEAAHKAEASATNTTAFTKEQSWKIDFATAMPAYEYFTNTIKTVGKVTNAPTEMLVLSAQTNGVVKFADLGIQNGTEVNPGKELFTVYGNKLAENNSSVRYAEALAYYEKAEQNYKRASELVKDKIISEKDFLEAKSEYEQSKAQYNNLKNNFYPEGQKEKCAIKGIIDEVLVENGSYVESGQAILRLSKNSVLLIQADVQQRYRASLSGITGAVIKTADKTTITTEELNGKLLSFGKSANTGNNLIPVFFSVDYNENLFPGSFVELYIKSTSKKQSLVVPNTALLEEQGLYFVFVQITPELFEKREVKIGISDGLQTVITKGILPTERIVTKGALQVKLAQTTGALDAHSGHVH